MFKKIKNITKESFEKYGYVISYDANKTERFQILLSEKNSVGWRMAVSKIIGKSISKISKHPDSMESFEPLDGVTLICVALPESPEEYEVFLLDKPVCLNQNIYHATLCLSDYSIVKITENLNVGTEEYKLSKEMQFGLFSML